VIHLLFIFKTSTQISDNLHLLKCNNKFIITKRVCKELDKYSIVIKIKLLTGLKVLKIKLKSSNFSSKETPCTCCMYKSRVFIPVFLTF